MKPKLRPRFAPVLVTAVTCAFSTQAATAATIFKADNPLDLIQPESWSGGVVPGAADTAGWNATVTSSSETLLGGALFWHGILIGNPGGPITIGGASALTLGRGGIDMASATQDLSLVAPVTMANGRQIWSVAPGRTLTAAAVPAKPAQPNTNNAGVLEVGTTGTVILGGATTNLIVDPANNPFVTFGKNDWAGLAGGVVVASEYTVADTALIGGVINDIRANLTGANPTDVSAIRFDDATPFDVTVANSGTGRTMTARGILVTQNSGGGSIGANLNTGAFIRPSRTSTAGAAFPIIQNSAADFTIGANIGNASSGTPVRLVKAGAGPLILLANNGHSGGTFVDAGTVRFGNGGTSGFPGGGDIVNHGALVFNRGDTVTLLNNISGTGGLTQAGPGTLSLTTSISTFTGPVAVTGGTLAATSLANLGEGPLLELNGGAFRFNAAFDLSARTVSFGASGAAIDTGGHSVTFANPIGNGGNGHFTKTGEGTLSLAAASTYTGGTTVAGGTLLATNPAGSATGTGGVTVETGSTLGGGGSISGAVTVESGGKLAPGEGVGTLTTGSLALESGALLDLEFSGGTDHDRVAVTGSGGLSISGGAIRLLQTGTPTAFTSPGTYQLISYSGAIAGGAGSLSVANPQPGHTYTFGTSGGSVTLTIATTGVVRSWVNNGSGSWDDAVNWSGTVPNGIGATVNFDTALTAPATITLSAARTIGSLTFNSATHGYTLAATGSGSLALNNGGSASNMINAAGSHTISAPVSLASSTTVSVPLAGDSLTLSGAVSGAGSLAKTGAGSLSLLSANTFTGGVTLSGGTTTFASGGLGSGPLAVSGATLRWAPGNTQDISNRTVTLAGNSVFDTGASNVLLASAIGNSGEGSLEKSGSGTLTLAGDATYSGGTTVSAGTLQLGNGGASGSVQGPIVNNGTLVINRSDSLMIFEPMSGTGSLVKNGPGELVLSAPNTFSGDTLLNAGTLTPIDPNALANSTLDYSAGTLDLGFLASLNLGGLSGTRDIELNDEFGSPITLTVGGNGVPTSYQGSLSGTGSFTKTGGGDLFLSGDHTYDGATLVNNGTLHLEFGSSISGGTLAVTGNSRLSIAGGSFTAASFADVSNAGSTSPTFELIDGEARFASSFNALGNANNNYLINLQAGVFEAASMTLGRSALNFSAEPAEGANATGLVINGAAATVTGPLNLGTASGTNSSVSVRVNAGDLTVHGPVTIGLNNGGRWSVIDVAGGDFTSTDTVTGITLGGPFAGNAALLVRAGTATAAAIRMGQGEIGGTGVIHLNGGSLFVGAGGIVPGSTGTFASQIRLRSGVLGADQDWATELPIALSAESPAGEIWIQASDVDGAARNITLNGGITGTGSIAKTGGGTLTLGGGHSFDGNLAVEQGAVTLTTPTLSDTANVSVTAGATLNLAFAGADQIASLTINGTAVASGTWGSPASSADNKSPSLSGTGILSVGVPGGGGPFADWAAAYGLTGADAEPDADPDKDGRSNLLEFALDESPVSGGASGKFRAGVSPIAASNAFVLTLPVRNGAIFSGTTAKTATMDGITYFIEGSNGLGNFDQAVTEVAPAASAGLPPLNAGWTYRSFRLDGPIATRGPRGFLRAGVQQAD